MTRAVMQQALDALTRGYADAYLDAPAIEALRAELASQEPVAYLVEFAGAGKLLEFTKGNYLHTGKIKRIPLYTKEKIE
jgi:hypothetical protein